MSDNFILYNLLSLLTDILNFIYKFMFQINNCLATLE